MKIKFRSDQLKKNKYNYGLRPDKWRSGSKTPILMIIFLLFHLIIMLKINKLTEQIYNCFTLNCFVIKELREIQFCLNVFIWKTNRILPSNSSKLESKFNLAGGTRDTCVHEDCKLQADQAIKRTWVLQVRCNHGIFHSLQLFLLFTVLVRSDCPCLLSLL